MKLSFQKLFFTMAFIFGLFAIMVFAKPILMPLSMALFIAFILLPVVKKLQIWGLNNMFSSFLAVLMLFILVGAGISLFSAEIMGFYDELSNFSTKLMSALSNAIFFINGNIGFIDNLNREELVEKGKEWLGESSGSMIKNTFSSMAAFLTGAVSTIIFTFLILIYREGLMNALVAFGDDKNKGKIICFSVFYQSVNRLR